VVPSAQRSARKRVGSDTFGGKAEGVVAAWKLFGATGTSAVEGALSLTEE
jgi:hypothetical protein